MSDIYDDGSFGDPLEGLVDLETLAVYNTLATLSPDFLRQRAAFPEYVAAIPTKILWDTEDHIGVDDYQTLMCVLPPYMFGDPESEHVMGLTLADRLVVFNIPDDAAQMLAAALLAGISAHQHPSRQMGDAEGEVPGG